MKKRNFILTLILSLAFVGCIFAGCTKTPAKYEITVKTFGANLGSIEGGNAIYNEGDSVTIKAIPATSSSSTNKFFCWLLNNKVASTEAEYTFEVNSETAGNYVAIFTSPYLEFFSLTDIILDSGIVTEQNQNTLVTKIEIYLGSIENLLTLAYTAESEKFDNKITLNSTDIYSKDQYPFAYNAQNDIFVRIVVTYVQDDITFVSSTNARIAGNDDVTKDVIELKNEAESTEEETVGIILNNGVNQENEDLQLNIAGTPTISLKFQRLSTFTFTTEEQPEEE